MRLYHFLSAHWALDDLEKRHIKIARLDDLNDPFEFICYQHPASEVREWLRRSKDALAKKHGVLCFSRTWKNPLLWSHYADRHKGICLDFDVADEALYHGVFYLDFGPNLKIKITVTAETVTLELAEDIYRHLAEAASSGGPYAAIYDLSAAKHSTIPAEP